MMRISILALCVISCSAISLRKKNVVEVGHPIAKVITLLQDLKGKSKAAGETEEISYTKFEYWCKNSKKELSKDIAERSENIDVLGEKIDSNTVEKKSLEEAIESITDELAAQDASKKAAKQTRDGANQVFTDADKEYEDTIKAIDACISALTDAKTKTAATIPAAKPPATKSDLINLHTDVMSVPKGEDGLIDLSRFLAAQDKLRDVLGFLEMKATSAQMQQVHQFLNEDPEVKAAGDLKTHTKQYKFKSGNVIELLKELKEKFEDDKLEAVKAETNAQNAFFLAEAQIDNVIAAAGKSKTEKEGFLTDTEKTLELDKAEKKNEEESLEAAENMLKKTVTECNLKASEWEERSKIRADEAAAIDGAIAVLSKVTGVRVEPPKNPVMPTTFLQLVSTPKDHKAKAVQLLRAAAKTSHSKALERLAMALDAKSDQASSTGASGYFDDIINMIQKMVFKLQADQTDEDNHKNWCDKELSKSDASIKDKEAAIEEKTTAIGEMKADVAKYAQKIASDTETLGELEARMKQLTAIRQEGKKENAEAVKDAEAALEAIAQATAIITEFYKSTGAVQKEAWESLLQAEPAVELSEKPSTWTASYSSVSSPSAQPGGIITVLQKVSEDYAKMMADTKAQEATDQQTYQNEMKASKIEKARMASETKELTDLKRLTSSKIAEETKKIEKHLQKELDAVKQYVKDLQPACVEGDSTYDDRKASRAKEIDALKDAIKELQSFEPTSKLLQIK